MTRPLRICYEGAFYHVMNRGRNKAAIFLSSHDFNSFLILLRQACERFNVKVLAYCLMSNHYNYKELMQEGIDQEIQKFYSKKKSFPYSGLRSIYFQNQDAVC